MGRRKVNNVFGHFEVDKSKMKSKCCICRKELNSINSSNLMRHLKTHKTEYDEVIALNSSRKDNTKLSTNSEIVKRECTNLVTVDGRPFALLNDESFQKIISLIPDCNVNINSRTVREFIIHSAAESRDELAKELNNKLICIKVDIGSLSLRSFMAINAQYIQEGKIVLKNLATIELLDRHTSEHLKEKLLYVLLRFRIGLENIYSLTTDNGSNMIKMGRLLNASVENPAINASVDDPTLNASIDDPTFNVSNNSQDAEWLYLSEESDDDYDADTMFASDADREDELTETFTSALSMHYQSSIQKREVAVIRCAAHTLQLAVLEACDGAEIQPVIGEARKIAKQLRSQKYATLLKKLGKNQALLDCPTRWNSTADMIERLLYLKEVCLSSEDSSLQLTERTWDVLQEYLNSLQPVKELSKKLQSEQLVMGDFYLQWLLCKIQLNSINSTLSKLLWNCMETREQRLFNSDAFLCAIFLDSRVNSTLSEDQRLDAKTKCLQLYRHLKQLNNSDKENINPSSNAPFGSQIQSCSTARIELDEFLSIKYVEAQNDIEVLIRRDDTEIRQVRVNNLEEEITSFLKEPLVKSNNNILKHWESNKHKYPRLYQIACVVLSSPATQVSVERLFSSLKFVVSRLRLNLKHNLIEDILFIRNNKLYNKK